MFILFIVLIVGPIVGGKYISKYGASLPLNLAQPTGLNNNDTYIGQTGTGASSGASITNAGPYTAPTAGSTALARFRA